MVSYLQMGLREGKENEKMAGWYDASTIKIYEQCESDSKKASQVSIEKLKEILKDFAKHPTKMFEVFTEKIGSTWLEPTFQTIRVNEPIDSVNKITDEMKSNKVLISFFDGKLSDLYLEYNNIYQIIIYISAGICLILGFKKCNLETVSLIIMVIGGFVFHLIWETKAYYVLTFYILLLPYAANGLQIGFEKAKQLCYNFQRKQTEQKIEEE